MRHFFILYVRDRTSFEYPPATYPISYYGNDHLKVIVFGIACDLNVQTDMESKKLHATDHHTIVSASLRTARNLQPGSGSSYDWDGERHVRRKQQ